MAADSAVDVLVRLMHKAKNESVRRQAASDLLDRVGYKATNKTEVTGAEGRPIRYRIQLVEPSRRWPDDDLQPQPLERPLDKSIN
jgi:hypothetical protein